MIGAGLGLLRLAPDAFWAMTPRELALALEGLGLPRSSHTPDRAGLTDLMRRFPDHGGATGS